jgi:hypothetical protein
MEFSHDEIQVIKESIQFRKDKLDLDSNHINRLDSIIDQIDSLLPDLNDRQRSLLSGCIKDYAIYPTKELNQLSDCQILLAGDKYRNEFEKMDLGYEVLNKLMKRGEKKNSLFKTTVETIRKLTNSKTIYYSINSDGEIYKIGITTHTSVGLEIEVENSDINNFEIGLLSKSFMKKGTACEVLKIIQVNIEKYRKSQNLSIALAILERACKSDRIS